MSGMLTLQNVPEEVQNALKAKAREQGKSVNDLAVEALAAVTRVPLNGNKERNLSGVVGTWVEDPISTRFANFTKRSIRIYGSESCPAHKPVF